MTKKNNEGFTLIEIIVGITVLAIAAAMMVPFFGKALTQSPAPIANLQQATSLQAVMENIISDSDNSFLFNGQKSGPTSCADLQTLQTRINGLSYGTYTVVQNGFITNLGDAPNNACSATNKILQVKISDTTGESLTSLFTIFITAG
jgi:prepilin-type N-terminal cleavage/methylation domain-containing protein